MRMQLWTISGRVAGDDDDTVHHIWALDQDDAVAAFEDQLREDSGMAKNDHTEIFIISETLIGVMENGQFRLNGDMRPGMSGVVTVSAL